MTATSLQRELDRLADGELDEREYYELLARLDRDPAGWRQCALALLEAQALRGELRRLTAQVTTPDACPAPALLADPQPIPPRVSVSRTASKSTAAAPARRSLSRYTAWQALAAALSLALAFTAGNAWRGRIQPQPQLARSQPAAPVTRPEEPPQRATPAAEIPRDPISHVRLVIDGIDAGPQHVDVPVYEWNGFPPPPATTDAPLVPAEVVQAVERLGGRVQREQFWAPVSLDDGRQAVVPIEQLRIVPAMTAAAY